jgi:hypothetical protein
MPVVVHGRNMESVRSGLSAIGVIFVKNSLLAMTGAEDSERAL